MQNNLIEDLITLNRELIILLTSMDVNSAILAAAFPTAPAWTTSIPLFAAWELSQEIILHKYSMLPIRDIIYDGGIPPITHGTAPDLSKLMVIEDTVP